MDRRDMGCGVVSASIIHPPHVRHTLQSKYLILHDTAMLAAATSTYADSRRALLRAAETYEVLARSLERQPMIFARSDRERDE